MGVMVFGGTTEGRLVTEWLVGHGVPDVLYCAATDYGASLAPQGAGVTTVRGPLSAEEKLDFVRRHGVDLVVDATHPYATHISESLDELSRAGGVELLRVVRPVAGDEDGLWTSVADAGEAAAYVARTRGNVLLTTGSRDLGVFAAALAGSLERLYVRVLPVRAALEAAATAGVATSHVVAMQGPFSADFNAALIRELGIRVLVSKRSGREGGFDQKAAAAGSCGIELVVIERRGHTDGLCLPDALRALEERYGR